MFRQTLKKLVPVGNSIAFQVQRNVGAAAGASQKGNLDPIQQLFVDKIREYRTRSTGGKLVDATPDSEAKLKDILSNLERAYGAKGVDMTQFPTFNFAEPALVWPGLTAEQIQKVQETLAAASEQEKLNIQAQEEEGREYLI